MVPVNFAVVENTVDARQRFVAVLGVDVLNVVVRLAVALFARQLQALPVKADGLRVFLTVTLQNFMGASAKRVVAVLHFFEFRMTGEGDFLYPLLIVIREMLNNT